VNKSKIDFFDHYSASWKHSYDREDLKKIEKLIDRCGLRADEILLEAGCGAGCITPLLSKRIDKGKIVSVDNSPGMIDEAGKLGLPDRIEFILSQVESLPLKNETFSAVLCFNCFPHFDHKKKAIEEFNRILKPGGRLFIIHSMSIESLNHMHKQASGPVEHDVFPPLDELKKMLYESGLETLKIEDCKDYFYLESGKIR
jgi:ubiquinone/menaquinone biosynthesis C-methylase UbiE